MFGDFPVKDKIAVVTGGGSGMDYVLVGLEISLSLHEILKLVPLIR